MEREISRIIKDIKTVKIQGAMEIAEAGLHALKIKAKKSKAKTTKAFISELEKTAAQIVKTRPTEPGLKHALLTILTKVKSLETQNLDNLKKFTLVAIKDAINQLDAALNQIAENGSKLIKSGDVILTHCHSHSVIMILQKAKQEGKKFKVIVTETRPLYQGILTAKNLLRAKIPIIYSEDSAIGYFMKTATKVLVGCDAILPDGSIVNKIGTLPIAIVAKNFGKPFYVAGGTIKFTPEVKIEFREAKEIISPGKLPGAKIVNPAFDVTPAEYVTELITEKGIIEPNLISKYKT